MADRRKKRRKKKPAKKKGGAERIEKALGNNHINYFSDLFIVAMVLSWIVVILVMAVMAVYSTVMYGDNSIWSDLGTLVAIPLSCGGAIWMIKNSVQHAIANKDGREVPADFPAVNDDMDIDGPEEPMFETEAEVEDVFKNDR